MITRDNARLMLNEDSGFELDDIIDAPVSVLVDMGVSIANSFLFEDSEIETSSVLSSINDDLGQFYQEHREGVELASFIGGVFVPGAAVAKALRYARTGKAGALDASSGGIWNNSNRVLDATVEGSGKALAVATGGASTWLNNYAGFGRLNARIQDFQGKALDIARTQSIKSRDYKEAMKVVRNSTLTEGFAEGIAYEAGLVALYNGHPWLDEYGTEDFLLGAALGGLFAPINLLIRNKAFKSELAKIEETKNIQRGNTHSRTTTILGTPAGDSLAHTMIIDQGQSKLIQGSGDQLADDTLARVELDRGETRKSLIAKLHSMASDDLQDLMNIKVSRDKEDKLLSLFNTEEYIGAFDKNTNALNDVVQLLNRNPEALAGANKLKVFDFDNGLAHHVAEKDRVFISANTINAGSGKAFSKMINSKGLPVLDRVPETPWGVETFISADTLWIRVDDMSVSLKDPESLSYLRALTNKFDGTVVIRDATGGIPTNIKNYVKQLDEAGTKGSIAEVAAAAREHAMTYEDILGQLDKNPQTQAVISSWFGQPQIMDSIQATLLRGVADDVEFGLDKLYDIFKTTDGQYNPVAKSVYRSDESFFNAYNQANKLKAADLRTTGIDIAVNDVPRLQAILMKVRNLPQNDQRFSIKIGGNVVDELDELIDMLTNAKLSHAKDMNKAGLSLEQISKATNTPLETVNTWLELGWKTPKDAGIKANAELVMYKTFDQSILTKPTMIEASAKDLNFAKQKEMQNTINLDLKTMDDIQTSRMEEIITGSESQGFRSLADKIILTEDMLKLKTDITVLDTSTKAAGFFGTHFASRDFALRNLGITGDLINTISKNFSGHVNNFIDEAQKIAKPMLEVIGNDAVARSMFYQIRQSLEGLSTEAAEKVFYDQVSRKIVTSVDDIGTPAEFLKYADGSDIQVTSDSVHEFLPVWAGSVQKDFLDMLNTNRALTGKDKIIGRGLWFPYDAVDDKFIAYLVDKANPGSTKVIRAASADELESSITSLRQKHAADGNMAVISRKESEAWNEWHNYAQNEQLQRVNVSLGKGGVASELIPTDASGLDRLLEGIGKEAWSSHRTFFRNSANDLFDKLESAMNFRNNEQLSGPNIFQAKLGKTVDAAELTHKTLLNYSLVEDLPIFGAINNVYTATWNTAVHSANNVFRGLKDVKRGMSSQASIKDINEIDYINLSDSLKAAGVPNPYKSVEDFINSSVKVKGDRAQSDIAKLSSLMVLFNLRLGEVAHSFVTTASLPVILSAEVSHQAGQLGQNRIKYMTQYMMEGAKLAVSNAPEARKIMDKAAERGYTTRQISEVTDLLANMHTKKGRIANLEDPNNNGKFARVFRMLTAPSDKAETFARELSYATGYRVAINKFPNASEAILESFAHNFTNRTMGNYTSRQRPTVFQGAMGATIGLYQTFMLTMGQNMLRYAEAGDRKAIAGLMAAQTSMFGVESLPGYSQLNEYIGEYVSDDHIDIRQTAYNILGNDNEQSRSMAEYALYGVPSTLLGAAIHTRAELAPRSPFGVDQQQGVSFRPALLNAAQDLTSNLVDVVKQTALAMNTDNGIKGTYEAVMRGLAGQLLWRPGARYAELALGRSFDRTGAVVSNDEFDSWPTLARVMGARPLKEQALRSLKYQGRYYDAVDTAKRREVTQALRLAVSGDNADNIDVLMQKYLDSGGTHRGFKAAMANAYMGLDDTYANRLLNQNIKHEGINDIIETYNY